MPPDRESGRPAARRAHDPNVAGSNPARELNQRFRVTFTIRLGAWKSHFSPVVSVSQVLQVLQWRYIPCRDLITLIDPWENRVA